MAQKWEYRRVRVDFVSGLLNSKWVTTVGQEKSSDKSQDDVFNELGELGWELVYGSDLGPQQEFVFKRPKL